MDSKILKALGIDPALIFIFLLVLIVILFVLYVNVTMKYNRLKSSYTTFMRGKDGKTLEESMMSGFSDVEAILKYTKQNRTDIQKLNKKMEKSYQKLGIVKYDAFNEMGGKLSFALAMLDPVLLLSSIASAKLSFPPISLNASYLTIPTFW